MKNMRRKLLSLLLVMAMVCSMVPSALAAGADTTPTSLNITASGTGVTNNVVKPSGSVRLTASAPQNTTLPNDTKYTWECKDGLTVPTGLQTNSYIDFTIPQNAAANTKYTVTCKATSATNTTLNAIGSITLTVENTTPAPTLALSPKPITTAGTGKALTATITNAPSDSYVKWSVSGTGVTLSGGPNDLTGTTTKDTSISSGTSAVYVNVAATASATITAQLYNGTSPNGTAVSGASDTCTVSVSNTYSITLSPSTVSGGEGYVAATITGLTTTTGYEVRWEADNAVLSNNSTHGNTNKLTTSLDTASSAKAYFYTTATTGTVIIRASLYTTGGTKLADATPKTINLGTASGYTLRLTPGSSTSSFGTSVPVNYNYYNDWNYNDNYYYGYRTFTVVPVLYDPSGKVVSSSDYTINSASYAWKLKGYSLGTSASTLSSSYSVSSDRKSSSATIYARDVYNYTSSSTANLNCVLSASITLNNGTNLGTLHTPSSGSSYHAYWTVYPGTYYHNTGSISASATVYANSTGYSLGSTDDAGSTSIVSELQSAVSSRYGYGSGWNSDRYYWDSSRSAWIDRTTGSIVSYEYNWNGWGNGWNNGYYGYDTLRYVTFSSVSTTGGSLSASTGTRYHVGGRTSYGSSALENVVFTPNGKSSTASFNITAYGDYGTYSGTITFNMSGTATPTTLTMSGTAGQNLNFKTSDFTSWWKGMYPSGSLSYVRFTSCSAGSLTNGVNGSSVVGNSTSCYASASGSQVAIGNLIYNSNSTGAATVTVNFTGYGSTTSSSSASTNRAGTLTITLAAGTPSVVSNLNVSYSCGASGVNLNATTFYNAVSASVTTASYITLGSPSSGTLTQNGVNVTSGSRFVLSGTSNNIGDVLYKPAAGFNGTATIPFVAYNSSNQTVATGSISIAVTQAAAPTTPGKTFPDTANHWSNTYVSVLASAGIVGGYDDGKFHPEREMTYGEALKLILLAAGYPEQAQGSGTNWAVNYLTLAINNGILPGSASSYTLSATVDRNTIAAMTAKALKLSPVTDTSTSPFVDSKDPYVLALNKAGIIFGDSSSGAAYYQGEKAFNRGEAAAIIYRIYNYRA